MYLDRIFATLLIVANLNLFGAVQHVGELSSYLSSKKVVVVKFFLPGCPPCGRLAPIYQAASNLFSADPNVAFLEVSGNNRAVTSRYGVRRFPTVLIFQNGREIMRREGAGWSAQALADVVNNALNS